MGTGPFDHPLLGRLLGDPETEALLSADVTIARMVLFERALARAGAAEGLFSTEIAEAIDTRLAQARPDVGRLAAGAAADGLVVPDLVRQLRDMIGPDLAVHLHKGATSQDLIDTAATLALLDVLTLFQRRIDALDDAFAALSARFGAMTVMAHTRMQAALPVRAQRKIASWRDPLLRHRSRIADVANANAVLTFGGAVGTLDALGEKGPDVAAHLAETLGLRLPDRARHSERDGFVEIGNVFAFVTGSLGKFGQDVALATQSEMGEIRLASGGGSSAMPHKSNPVKAEVLVTLARFNAALAGGMQQALVHENERSGAAWTLEWMLLPQMAVACGAALRLALELVPEITFVETSAR